MNQAILAHRTLLTLEEMSNKVVLRYTMLSTILWIIIVTAAGQQQDKLNGAHEIIPRISAPLNFLQHFFLLEEYDIFINFFAFQKTC